MRRGLTPVALLAAMLAAACAGDAPPAPATRPVAATATGNPNFRLLNINSNPRVMVIPLSDEESTRYGMVDRWQWRFVSRRLEEAANRQYDLVLLEIDTNGGMLLYADEIAKEIGHSKIPVVAFVRGKAFSAGAVIALSCQAIVMEKGTWIGGAQVLSMFGTLNEAEEVKLRSNMEAMVRAFSAKNGYPASLVVGMVDRTGEIYETTDPAHRFLTSREYEDWEKNAAVRGSPPPKLSTVKEDNEILTLTADQALGFGLAAAAVKDRDQFLASQGLQPAAVDVASVSATERAARWLGNPILMALLALVGLIGLIWEIKSPGHGVGYVVFGFSFGVFFWAALFADTAGTLELALFALGALLLALELFVLPGFGVAGFAGILLVVASIVLSFVPAGTLPTLFRETTPLERPAREEAAAGLFWASTPILLICGLVIYVLLKGANLPWLRRLALKTSVGEEGWAGGAKAARSSGASTASALGPEPAQSQEGAVAVAATAQCALVGQEVIAETALRPAGKVRLGDALYDALSEGEWIEAGSRVKVLEVQASGLLVRQITEEKRA